MNCQRTQDRTFSRCESRRGQTTVEYAMILVVVVAATSALATLQNHAFAPLVASPLFAAESPTYVPSGLTVPLEPVVSHLDTTSYAISMVSLMGIGVICLVGWTMLKAKNVKKIGPTEPPSEVVPPIDAPVDAAAKLREMLFDKRSTLLSEMSEEIGHVFEGSFEVFHLMSTNNKVVAPDLPAADVRMMMTKNMMHHLLVCDGDQLVGVVSDRDLSKPHAKCASDLMTPDPITVSPMNPLVPTVSTMINKRISCLPVTRDGVLQGVLTRTDLLLAFQCTLQLMLKMQQESLRNVA